LRREIRLIATASGGPEVSAATHFAPGRATLLISDPIGPQVIHSNLQQTHRFSGSNRVLADEGLWMNLWKLWIAIRLLLRSARAAGCTDRRPHASMEAMNEVEVAQAEMAEVPATFDRSAVLLDVREDDEWQRGHAAGAQHIPMGEVPARLNEIDPDAKLYVVCHAGGRSLRVAHYLARNGFVPVNVNGGMLAWVGAGRPVVTGDGGVGTV
jgi:rhodanese-related sulfurtransferase